MGLLYTMETKSEIIPPQPQIILRDVLSVTARENYLDPATLRHP